MNCAEFQTIVHELAHENMQPSLARSVSVMARFHADTCEECAARLAEAQSLQVALNNAVKDSEEMEASTELENSLTAAFREHQRNMERARYRERRARLRWAEWAALAAAVAVLLAVGAWNFSRGRAMVNGTKANQATATVNSANNGTANATPQEVGVEAAAEDSDFVPLPYAEEILPDDSGVVVRVSMARSALGSLGYPIDEVDGGDVIQADLLIGEDGWPRAVRVVQ